MVGASRLLHRSREAVREYNNVSGCLTGCHRLEYDVVAALGGWRAIPGAMECNEDTVAIGCRELRVGYEQQVIWCPVGGEERGRAGSPGAQSHFPAAIAAILGREYQ